MQIHECKKHLLKLLSLKTEIANEAEFTSKAKKHIFTIGYATNLTPDVITQASRKKVDLILTHHDAWDFIYGMKDTCTKLLKSHCISHFYAHLPLDSADFGTSASLLKQLGAKTTTHTNQHEGYFCGRIGELEKAVKFETLVNKIQYILKESVLRWQNNKRLIKKVGIVTGGGQSTSDIKELLDKGCDIYITGEKVLYTIEYASFVGINLIVGSHTFTELFGIESLSRLLKARFKETRIIKLHENHIEFKNH